MKSFKQYIKEKPGTMADPNRIFRRPNIVRIEPQTPPDEDPDGNFDPWADDPDFDPMAREKELRRRVMQRFGPEFIWV